MNFNRHWELEGKHAFLSASKYHWINYDIDRVVEVYKNQQAKYRGTLLHQFACDAIKYGVLLAEDGSTLSLYVNDCITDGMNPEVILCYSENAFGTADAISFDEDEKILKIYDLKTGKSPASIHQLEIYAALFCLEYQVNPIDILIHLRIYQNNEVLLHNPESDDIWNVMDRIIAFDDAIRSVARKGR